MFGALLISVVASVVSAGLSYALSPTQKIESGRLDDLTSSTSSYGSPLPWAWGTVRLPGSKIWLDYLEEVKKKEKQGGGFFGLAPKVEITNFIYYGYWAEVFAECPFRPAVDYQRLWMNKKLVYSTIGGAETIAEGGKFAKEYLRFYKGEPAQAIDPLLRNKQPISSYSYGIPTNPTERDAFLRTYGIAARTAILSPAYNHRAYTVAQRRPLGDFFNSLPTSEAEIIFSKNCTVGQIIGDIFSLFYESDRVDVSLLDTPVKGFSIKSVGAAKSAIQTLQQAYFFDLVDSNGVFKFIPLNHPRDVVNLRIEDLAAHTGDNKPVDYEIIEADPASLPSKVTVQYIDPDLDYDTNTQDSGLEVKGHYNPNPTQLSFDLVLSASEAATIADRALILAWIAKYTYKFKLPPAYLDLEIADLIANVFDDRDLPIRLTQLRLGANLIVDCEGTAHEVFFWNLVRELESGGVTLGVADYNVILEVSGTPTNVASSTGTIYSEGTDYTVTAEGNIQVLETGNISPGTDLVVSTTKPPQPDETTTTAIAPPGDTELLVLDIPLIDNDHPDYTLYLAAGGGENWNGSAIYISTDGSRYVYTNDIQTFSVYGNCDSNLLGDKINVVLNRPEMESVTDSDLSLGFNLALAGNKIIQFKTAQLIDVNTYQLSNITTGLRGTETQPDPVAGDRFVLLTGSSASLTRFTYDPTDIGEVRYFKAVSPGQDLDDVEPIQITIQGIAQRPYAPVNLAATKNPAGDITITWDRRDRHSDMENPPILSEDLEQYVVNFMNQRAEIVRNISTNKKSYTYLATEQEADSGAVLSTITVSIAQVSPKGLRDPYTDVGNGSFATATLTPELVEPEPAITSFTPTSGTVGDRVTITGTDLNFVTAIKIGDIEQSQEAVIDSENIEFRVALGTTSGLILVHSDGGTAASSNALIVEAKTTTAGHVISDDTTAYPQRTNLKFVGATVTDDETTDTTTVEASSGNRRQIFGELYHTTPELGSGEYQDVDLTLPAVFFLRQIYVSSSARIQLYGTDAARTEQSEGSGLILDMAINSNYLFAAGILAQNCDLDVTDLIYARIINDSGISGAIDVTFKYFAIA